MLFATSRSLLFECFLAAGYTNFRCGWNITDNMRYFFYIFKISARFPHWGRPTVYKELAGNNKGVLEEHDGNAYELYLRVASGTT